MDFVPFSAPSQPGLDRWKVSINNQARHAHVPACALAAIVSRETGGRNVFQSGMPPGPGCGVGLCQITANVDWTDPRNPVYFGTSYNLFDPSSNLYIAAQYFLAPAIQECLLLREEYPKQMNAIEDEILYFAFVAYNAGIGTVRSAIAAGNDPDKYSTNAYGRSTLEIYHDLCAIAHQTKA